jgi:hypothetical protein
VDFGFTVLRLNKRESDCGCEHYNHLPVIEHRLRPQYTLQEICLVFAALDRNVRGSEVGKESVDDHTADVRQEDDEFDLQKL